MILDPLPLSQTVTISRTPSPLERDVLYGRPHSSSSYNHYNVQEYEIRTLTEVVTCHRQKHLHVIK